jgi:hypothetical protein
VKPLNDDLSVVIQYRMIVAPLRKDLLNPKSLMLGSPPGCCPVGLALSVGNAVIDRAESRDLTGENLDDRDWRTLGVDHRLKLTLDWQWLVVSLPICQQRRSGRLGLIENCINQAVAERPRESELADALLKVNQLTESRRLDML